MLDSGTRRSATAQTPLHSGAVSSERISLNLHGQANHLLLNLSCFQINKSDLTLHILPSQKACFLDLIVLKQSLSASLHT